MEIKLAENEEQLCTLLDECTKWLKEAKGTKTSCRVAGGWVRDKLLGSDSNDIDIALEDMMGAPFVEHFVEFVRARGIAAKDIAKVERNPDQSKHLETAKTTLLGIELDFVNLRSEAYAEDSRIPTQVLFGTPLEDALRRDITINALFYNVHTRAVEDHTGNGLNDLRDGIIRTPLPPSETFTDDPLRIIRCVRFASRFGFEMVQELKDAASNPDIQNALVQKISRERVGEELHKMMKGRDPVSSITLINQLSLYPQIFHLPPNLTPTLSASPLPAHTSVAAARILQSIPALHPRLAASVTDIGTRARLYLACALTPYRGITYQDAKAKTHPACEVVLREGLKLGAQNHYLDGIPALFAAADMIKSRMHETGRVAIGLLLREKVVHNPHTGSHWETSILFSLVQELVDAWSPEREELNDQVASVAVERYNAFVGLIEELNLTTSADAKPLLDGREVVSIFSSKPGQWTGAALARVVEWQLAHPKGTKEECTEWIKGERQAGRIEVPESGAGKSVEKGRKRKNE